MLQVGLLAEFVIKYHTQNRHRLAGNDLRGGPNKVAGADVLCTCLSEVHKDICLWNK